MLRRLKGSDEKFLDLGCCFGQDLRKLVADGAPSQNLYASDLRRDFWELGYELFRDRDTLASSFIEGDIFDAGSALTALDGQMDVVYAGSFLHLFDYEGQRKACERIVRLLRPKPGSVVLGRQVGSVVAGERNHRTNKGSAMWRHDIASFERMWAEVGAATDTKWRVDAQLAGGEDMAPRAVEQGKDEISWHDSDMRRLRFAVFRE